MVSVIPPVLSVNFNILVLKTSLRITHGSYALIGTDDYALYAQWFLTNILVSVVATEFMQKG